MSLIFFTDTFDINLKQAKVIKCLPDNKTEHLKVEDRDFEFEDLSEISEITIIAVSCSTSLLELALSQFKVISFHAVRITNVEVEQILHIEDSKQVYNKI